MTAFVNPGPYQRLCQHCGQYSHEALWTWVRTCTKASEWDGYTICPLCERDDRKEGQGDKMEHIDIWVVREVKSGRYLSEWGALSVEEIALGKGPHFYPSPDCAWPDAEEWGETATEAVPVRLYIGAGAHEMKGISVGSRRIGHQGPDEEQAVQASAGSGDQAGEPLPAKPPGHDMGADLQGD